MIVKAYDKYHKQWLLIESTQDEMWDWSSSSNEGVEIRLHLRFSALDGGKDNCDPKRWSDLEQFEIIDSRIII